MAAPRRDLCILAKPEKPPRIWRRPIDPNDGLRSDRVAFAYSEDRMSSGDVSNLDRSENADHPVHELWINRLDPLGIGPEAAPPHNKHDRRSIDGKDVRPPSGDDVEQGFDRRCLDRLKDSEVDGRDGIGVPSSERDQILVRLLGRTEARPEPGDSLLLERNDLAHGNALCRG